MSSPAIAHVLISSDTVAAEFNDILELSDILGIGVSVLALIETTTGLALTETITGVTLEES